MVCIVTRRTNEREKDILTGNEHYYLTITDLNGQFLFAFPPPPEGWTDDSLEQIVRDNPQCYHKYGADAYLGLEWVGNTEV